MMPHRSESTRKPNHTEMPIRKGYRQKQNRNHQCWLGRAEGGATCDMLVLTMSTGVWQFFKTETKTVLEVRSYLSTWRVHRGLWPGHICTWVPTAAVYYS